MTYQNEYKENKSTQQIISLYQRLFESVNDGLLVVDNNDNIVLINPKFFDLWKREQNEIFGKNITEQFPHLNSHLLQKWNLIKENLSSDHKSYYLETSIEINAEIQHFNISSYLITGHVDDQHNGTIFSIWHEISSLEEWQKSRAAERNNLLRSTIDSMDDLVFVLDEENAFLECNQSPSSLFYLPPSEFLGKKVNEVLPNDVAISIGHGLRLLRETKSGQQVEYPLTMSDKTYWFNAKLSPRFDDNGNYIGSIAVVRDITGFREIRENDLKHIKFHKVLNLLLTLAIEDKTLEEIAETVLDKIVTIPEFSFSPRGLIFFKDVSSDDMTIVAHKNMSPELLTKCSHVPLNDCRNSKNIVNTNEILEKHPANECEYQLGNLSGYWRHTVPILSTENSLLGVIILYVREQQKLFKIEEEFIDTVAKVLATIIVRKRMFDEIKLNENKFRSLVESLSVGAALISPKLEIMYLNRVMKEWFPNIDVNQKPICYQVYNNPPRTTPCDYCPTTLAFQDGKLHQTITETPQGGEIKNFDVTATPIFGINGEIEMVVETVEDVTLKLKKERTPSSK